MRLRRRLAGDGVPRLNTAALPDLIFTVLFFFMIVTHMRKTDVQVQYAVPNGTELQDLKKKHTVAYVYVGRDLHDPDKWVVQVNNALCPITQLAQVVHDAKESAPLDAQDEFTVSLKADAHAPMHIISQVKDALRAAGALNVSFSGSSAKPSDKTTK